MQPLTCRHRYQESDFASGIRRVTRALANHFSILCRLLAITFLCRVPGYAQQIVAPLLAGQTEIRATLPEGAAGVEVQVNQAAAVVKGFPVQDAKEVGVFVITLKSPLVAGTKVRIRVLQDGVARAWSDEAPVYRQAADCPRKPSLSFTPAQLSFKSQPWGLASDSQTVTVKNEGSEDIQFEPKIVPEGSFRFSPTPDCQNPLPPKATCTLHVVYQPSGAYADAQKGLLGNAFELEKSATATESAVGDTLKKADSTPKEMLASSVAEIRKNMLQASPDQRAAKGRQLIQTITDFHNSHPSTSIILSGVPEHWKYPFTRAVAGVDLSAPSSRTVKQAYFIEFDLIAPLGSYPWSSQNSKADPLDSRFWVWFNPRITSLPQSANYSALSTINASGGFLDSLTKSGTVKDIAQGLDVSGGLEIALIKPRNGVGWWSEYPNTKARLGISLIGGVGAATPFSTDKTDLTSRVNQSICDAYNKGATHNFNCVFRAGATAPVIQDPITGTDKPFISFVTPDRSRFFRRFYTGVRLKTFFFNQDITGDCFRPRKSTSKKTQTTTTSDQGDSVQCETPYDVFPGIVDLSVGKDEAVTGGHLNKWLFRLEASYPLPFYPGVHIFGSIYTGGRSQTNPPFSAVSIQAPNNNTDNPIQTDANTYRFPTPPLNRDYFRIGVGVDLVQILKRASSGGQPQKSVTNGTQ